MDEAVLDVVHIEDVWSSYEDNAREIIPPRVEGSKLDIVLKRGYINIFDVEGDVPPM